MTIQGISFSGTYNTREAANIVSGKEYASYKFLSSVTGIPQGKLISNYSSDILTAGSSYCAKKIAKNNPDFKLLREIGEKIQKIFLQDNFTKESIAKLKKLIDKRDFEIEKFCSKQGETVEISEFNIPFFV